jgi:DNA polymerase III delta' subunit
MSKLFSDIYGQQGAVAILSAQLNSNTLSHGYTIFGNEGTGRGYLAFEFARYILCEKHAEDACSSCQKFIHGSHPDFIFLDGTEGIKIDQVKEAIERINLSPNLSSYKVLLLSKAENMGIEAANALLKTLEEPPSDSIIILTAISEKSLPETIVSRTQKIKLSPLATKDIEKILIKEFSGEEVAQVIAYAQGSVGEAKKLIENPTYRDEKIEIFNDVETLIISKSVAKKFKIVERHEKAKNLKNFFDIFSGVIFNRLEDSLSEKEAPKEGDIDRARLLGLSQKILKIYADLDYNVSLRLAMEGMILKHLTYD